MTSTPIDRLAVVLGCAEPLVAAVRRDQWSAPTPCVQWKVRHLVNHLVGGNFLFARILRGEQPLAGTLGGGDQLGDDPVAAYREAAAAVLAAFRQPGVLERVFTVPVGSVPGTVALHLRTTEVLVHGWDLACATGHGVSFPDDIVEQELEFTQATLPQIPSNRKLFGPPRSAPDDAPAIDRLAALLGRAVTTAGDPE